MKRKFNHPAERNHFLVPGMPTPNGRIHLGHIAGPYLKMDVLKRKVQRSNGFAYLCSGSDVYESYVELKASQLGISTIEVANFFHNLISKDFKALNIDFDLYINPLDKDLQKEFISFHQNLLQDLINSGSVVEREELVPYDSVTETYLTGCWIKGICPNCKSPTGSYLCEYCGTHYRPQDIFSQEIFPNASLVKKRLLYLKLDGNKLLENTKKIQNGLLSQILERYIELQGPYIRLTTVQKTGIPFNWDNTPRQIIFNYPGVLFYSVYCGHLLQNKYGISHNPMSAGANFVTCTSFGIDNVIPVLAGVYWGGNVLSEYRAFNYYFCNYFYHLNDEKFSTSRMHTIWSGDIIELSQFQPDAVRYFLCKVNPEFGPKNLDAVEFLETINNDLHRRLNKVIAISFEGLRPGEHYEVDDFIFTRMEDIILKQNQMMQPGHFRFSAFLEPIDEWIINHETLIADQRVNYFYWWLKALAYLCYPIMPGFSTALWKNLSGEVRISSNDFFSDDTLISKDLTEVFFKEVNYADLSKSLPSKRNVHEKSD